MALIRNILTIAGADPSGGAGIQADLKTIAALGTYGLSVITAITVQNSQGVQRVEPLAADLVAEQIEALYADIQIDAVKIGMLATAEIATAVATCLKRHQAAHVVIDPVMVSSSGRRLLTAEAIAVVIHDLLPLAEVITPNLDEAAVLIGRPIAPDRAGMAAALADLDQLGAQTVLLKGGHMAGDHSLDLFYDQGAVLALDAPRIITRNSHGTGCTLSSAVAALLPRYERGEAVQRAKAYLTQALAAADRLTVGSGHGPLHHFQAVW